MSNVDVRSKFASTVARAPAIKHDAGNCSNVSISSQIRDTRAKTTTQSRLQSTARRPATHNSYSACQKHPRGRIRWSNAVASHIPTRFHNVQSCITSL